MGFQINLPAVAKALSAITMSIHLVWKSCPFQTAEEKYILPVKCLIEGIWRDNSTPIPQLALPISVTNDCCDRGVLSKSLDIQATGYLILFTFYYLLRCGEYTAPCYVQRRNGSIMWSTRTRKFMVGDVGFWKGGCQIPHNSPLHLLLQADSATLNIKKPEERAHGTNHTPQVLCLRPMSFQGPSTSDFPHPCQRRHHITVCLQLQVNNQGSLCHNHSNISHNRHPIIRFRPEISPRRHQPWT